MDDQDEIELDFAKLFNAVWNKIVVIVLVALLTSATFYGYTVMFVAPQYRATALLYVNSSNLSLANAKVSISTQDLTAAKSLVDTYIVILKTRTTLEEVIEVSGLNYTYGQLSSMVHAAPVNDTEVFSVTVTCHNSEHAEILANTIARLLPNRISSIVEGSSARIVDAAVENPSRVSPNYFRNAFLGFLSGFFGVAAIVVVTALLDDKIRSTETISSKYQIPVLAVIPDLVSDRGGSAGYGRPMRSAERKSR